MGNVVDKLVGKDGIITKVVETVPGGGLLTAPVHAAAGNTAHAVQAAISAAGTGAATAVLGLPGPAGASIAAGAGVLRGIAAQYYGGRATRDPLATIDSIAEDLIHIIDMPALEDICEEMSVPNERRAQIMSAKRAGDCASAGALLFEAGHQKMRQSTSALSADSGGRRSIKSAAHGAYLRAVEPEWRVDAVWRAPQASENWYIEDWGGKVVLKGRGGPNKPGQFLRALPDGSVDLVRTHPKGWEMWKPFKNADGTWSLLGAHGMWLSIRDDGFVTTVVQCGSWEHFVLEWW